MTKKKWPYTAGDLLKRLNSYEIFYDRTRKRLPFNTGDYLIEVTTWEGLTVLTTELPTLFPFINQTSVIYL